MLYIEEKMENLNTGDNNMTLNWCYI